MQGLLDVARLVGSDRSLDSVLSEIARTISEALGFQGVAFNLYRPAWDDFIVSTVHGSEAMCETLLGETYDWSVWELPLQDRFQRRGAYFIPHGMVDWSDPESVIEYLVAYSRVLGGGQRPFDESAARDLARREIGRAHDFAAARNHDLLREGPAGKPLSAVAVPTLVIHGTADPMFPIGHGNALADEIPNASLLRLERAGHGVEQADWETIAGAILDHTGKGGG